ncbi:MAG: 50S ribosomal protein L17 [Acidobacteria bacterium]|jgi:large subunit ribosomal protein L17|nr:50S ribosomal protein L17 [Acidobacteriota bacterium]
MRHRCANRKLGRTSEHRIAMLRNLAAALIEHERITTTMGKAKELRPYAERLISKAQQDTVHSRRMVARDLHDRDLVKRLFDEVAPRFSGRPGGYTRVLRTMPRRGDAAEMAIIELVVRKEPEVRSSEPAAAKKERGLAGLAKRITGGRKKKTAGAE